MFPTFWIAVDDSVDCLVAYEIVHLENFDMSTCDYVQGNPNLIETLALTESHYFDLER